MKRYNYIIGIDEAGRGPLAGPLVVAGMCIPADFDKNFLHGIKDSKKLSQKKREWWYTKLTTNPAIRFAVASISPNVIDRINIARAANRGALSVYKKLITPVHRCTGVRERETTKTRFSCHALLDGSLKLPSRISHEVIIKGDEKIQLIAAASIIAKVTRDELMQTLHKKYPRYGFAVHKGYGTKKHLSAIRKFGVLPVHRMTFGGVLK